MIRHKLLAGALASFVVLAFTGCGEARIDDSGDSVSVSATADKDKNQDIEGGNTEEETFYVTPTEDYAHGESITIGDIIQFDGDQIHIISGDLVQVYAVNEDQLEDFYVGQTVELIKGDDKDQLKPFIVEDFSIRSTNMGHVLTTYTGLVTEVTDGHIIIDSEGQEVKMTTYQDVEVPIGTRVSAITGIFGGGEEPTLISLLNEDTKLALTVTAIDRSDEGHMLVMAKDSNEGDYKVSPSTCMTELNFSEIILGDTLTVYHEGIMESWPMQVKAVLMTK